MKQSDDGLPKPFSKIINFNKTINFLRDSDSDRTETGIQEQLFSKSCPLVTREKQSQVSVCDDWS